MRKYLSLSAILCGLFLWLQPQAAMAVALDGPGGKKETADPLIAAYAQDVGNAHACLEQYNDVTSVVEILNSLKETNQQKIDQSFQRALRKFFPKSSRVAQMEPWARRKLARFFDYY